MDRHIVHKWGQRRVVSLVSISISSFFMIIFVSVHVLGHLDHETPCVWRRRVWSVERLEFREVRDRRRRRCLCGLHGDVGGLLFDRLTLFGFRSLGFFIAFINKPVPHGRVHVNENVSITD